MLVLIFMILMGKFHVACTISICLDAEMFCTVSEMMQNLETSTHGNMAQLINNEIQVYDMFCLLD